MMKIELEKKENDNILFLAAVFFICVLNKKNERFIKIINNMNKRLSFLLMMNINLRIYIEYRKEGYCLSSVGHVSLRQLNRLSSNEEKTA